jgi:nitrogen fixation NifU-like protein
MDIYREHLLDHYHHPRGWGLKQSADIERTGRNPLCGDEITIQLTLTPTTISAMRFEGQGCVISRAAASLLSEYCAGKPVVEIQRLQPADMEHLLGIALPPARLTCGLLALDTIKQALAVVP